MWILVSICNFSHFISLTPVESLSKESILNAFENYFHRFGRSVSIETDLGTNFSAAKSDLENEETLEENAVKEITQSLKSSGVSLIQRAAKAPWIQGSVERSNQIVKRIFPEKRLAFFQTLNVIEYIIPVWSKL